MAWDDEDNRRYRDRDEYRIQDRFLNEASPTRRARDYSFRDREDYDVVRDEPDRDRDREYRAYGRESRYSGSSSPGRDWNDREWRDRSRSAGGWNERKWSDRDLNDRSDRGVYDRSSWPREAASSAGYTSSWNNQAFGGWSNETGFERPGYGGDWNYGRRYGSDYMYGTQPAEGEGRWSREGRYYGRGPRNWRRPDSRIEDEVYETLSRHGYIDASEVEVQVKDCEVTLQGRVHSKEEKRLAEDLVERIFGVEDVHNKLKVEKRDQDEYDLRRHDRDRKEKPAVEGHEPTVRKILNA